MKSAKLLAVLGLFAIRLSRACGPRSAEDHAKRAVATSGRSLAAADLKLSMRKLWTDHTVWTRDYIIAAVDGSKPDAHGCGQSPDEESGRHRQCRRGLLRRTCRPATDVAAEGSISIAVDLIVKAAKAE